MACREAGTPDDRSVQLAAPGLVTTFVTGPEKVAPIATNSEALAIQTVALKAVVFGHVHEDHVVEFAGKDLAMPVVSQNTVKPAGFEAIDVAAAQDKSAPEVQVTPSNEYCGTLIEDMSEIPIQRPVTGSHTGPANTMAEATEPFCHTVTLAGSSMSAIEPAKVNAAWSARPSML